MTLLSRYVKHVGAAIAGIAAIGATLVAPVTASAQAARAPAPARSPRDAATLDITGYWVAVVTEDWKYRMVGPAKGVYDGIPLNAEGRRVADTWDAARDRSEGQECRSYGAANIMRVPARLHIAWDDADTLRIDVDAGTQTRLFEFVPSAPAPEPSWQGASLAEWQQPAAPSPPGSGGILNVSTTRMLPGYLRENGVPYSERAVLTEYYNRMAAPNGDSLLVITTIVEDPTYLTRPYVTSQNFKRVADDTGWNPTPCSAS
jgi:hypothetical protein